MHLLLKLKFFLIFLGFLPFSHNRNRKLATGESSEVYETHLPRNETNKNTCRFLTGSFVT